MTSSIEATLEGSYAVRIAGRLFGFTGDLARGGVLPRAARKLLAEGADPSALLSVTRDGSPVFADASLAHWASISVEEREKRPARVVPFRVHSSMRGKKADGEVASELRNAA